MKRRDFIKSALSTSVAVASGAGSLFTFSNAVASNAGGTISAGRTLVNLMLPGGADQRFLLVPEPGTAYAEKFWEKRQGLYQNNPAYSSYEDVWTDLYLATTANGQTFGIHKNAYWLWQEFNKGNVAVIANMVASENRRHDHSQLIMHSGDLKSGYTIVDRDGWGGRLVQSSGVSDNVVCMSDDVSPYCYGVNSGNRLEKVVHIRNSRNFGLPDASPLNPWSSSSVIARALKAYYGARGPEIEAQIAARQKSETWPFRKFFQHEASIRNLGDILRERLQAIEPELSTNMQGLLKSRVRNKDFGQQIVSLYDSLLAADILHLKSAYIEYHGWDTHRNEKTTLESNILDIFGTGKALHTLQAELGPIQGANEKLVYVVTSDFGRQLAANGDKGTDHGSGTYGIVIGDGVNGGIYGEMFPESEIMPDSAGVIRFDKQGADIEGRTSFEWVMGAACEWVAEGAGSQVFPNLANSAAPPRLEAGVNIKALFQRGHAIFGTVALLNGTHTQVSLVATSVGADTSGTVNSDTYGYYHINSITDDSYTVTPSKKYFTFDPPQHFVQMGGADVYNVDFIATPVLHIRNIMKLGFTADDYIEGYNFLPNETLITVGGVPGVISEIVDTTRMWVAFPVGVRGMIVVSTPTETYTHDVLYENI